MAIKKCKNCGHEINDIQHRFAFGKSCVIRDSPDNVSCGCTNPEPMEEIKCQI